MNKLVIGKRYAFTFKAWNERMRNITPKTIVFDVTDRDCRNYYVKFQDGGEHHFSINSPMHLNAVPV